MGIIDNEGIEGEEKMSNCPFWSSKKQPVSCYSECPMLQFKEEQEEDCVFKTYTSSLRSSFKNIRIVENYEDDIEEEDKLIQRFKVTSSY